MHSEGIHAITGTLALTRTKASQKFVYDFTFGVHSSLVNGHRIYRTPHSKIAILSNEVNQKHFEFGFDSP